MIKTIKDILNRSIEIYLQLQKTSKHAYCHTLIINYNRTLHYNITHILILHLRLRTNVLVCPQLA